MKNLKQILLTATFTLVAMTTSQAAVCGDTFDEVVAEFEAQSNAQDLDFLRIDNANQVIYLGAPGWGLLNIDRIDEVYTFKNGILVEVHTVFQDENTGETTPWTVNCDEEKH